MFGDLFKNASSLSVVESFISAKYAVPNITASDLEKALGEDSGSGHLIFDIRQKEEYDRSHIHSAIHVDPGTSESDFRNAFSEQMRGKHLVFYCSVGERSSEFLAKVMEDCKASGAASISNLKGGIFRWYNEGHPVENDKGPTDEIHPYNAFWGMFIERRRNL